MVTCQANCAPFPAISSEFAARLPMLLRQSPIDDLAISDLMYRKLIIRDEIQHNRRLVERFSKFSAY
jgi:hypothetical protein